MGRQRNALALPSIIVVVLAASWSLSSAAPEHVTVPLAVLLGPTVFLYYIRFAMDCADIWAFVGWFSACLVASALPAFLALRDTRTGNRIGLGALACAFWILSGLLAIAMAI